jgi:predicted DNA binding CopG/RHH family protein
VNIFLDGRYTLNTLLWRFIKMATKTETLTIRVTEEEKEKVKKLAEAADVTVSKYLHKIL